MFKGSRIFPIALVLMALAAFALGQMTPRSVLVASAQSDQTAGISTPVDDEHAVHAASTVVVTNDGPWRVYYDYYCVTYPQFLAMQNLAEAAGYVVRYGTQGGQFCAVYARLP